MERISADATRLAIVDLPGIISICDATTGQFVRSLGRLNGMTGRLDFSHDGRLLAVGRMGPVAQNESFGLNRHHAGLEVFDAENGRLLDRFDVGVNSFRTNADFHFHRDGPHLAMMDNSSQGNAGLARLRIWDLQQHVELPAVVMPWRTGRVVGCTADGATWVIAQGNQGRQVVLVDATTREVVATHEFPGRIGLFEPRHNRVGVAQDGDLVFYDLATRQEQVRLLGFPSGGMTAFSPDGRRLAIAESSAGASQSRVEVWSLETGRRLLTLAGPRSVSALRFTSDDHRLLARGAGWPVDYPSQVWDATPLLEAEAP
jgi:hypothetical protein